MIEREFNRLRIENIQSAAMSAKAGIVCWFLFLVFSAIANPVYAQWKPLYTRPYCYFTKIYFLDLPGKPLIGFAIGGDILKTTDGGYTWRKIPLDPSITEESGLWDIAFKDSLTGWISVLQTYTSIGGGEPGGCIKTTDGGETWSSILPGSESGATAIYFNKKSNGLFLSTWFGIGYNQVSWDEGATWQYQTSNNGLAYGRCGFANDDTGVMVQFDVVLQPWYRTTDAGQTWKSIAMDTPCYTVLAIPGTETYYANVGTGDLQHEGIILRTDDTWNTWRTVYEFPPMQVPYSGWNSIASSFTITGDSNNLIVQYGPGIYRSTDGGNSWHFLCGPGWADVSRPGLECYAKDNEVFCVTDDSALDVTIWKLNLDSLNLISSNFSEQFTSGAKRETIHAGDTVRVDFLSDTALGPAVGVDSVSVSISYDNLSLALAYFVPSSGWSIKDSFSSGGYYHLLLVASDTLSLANPNKLLRGVFASYLTIDSLQSKVYLDSVHLYGHRLNCDCPVESVLGVNSASLASALDSVEIDLTGCGDSILLRFMEGNPLFEIVSIQPNPAAGSISIKGSPGPFTIFDPLGRSYAAQGNATTLDISSLHPGVYFVSDGRSRAKFIKE